MVRWRNFSVSWECSEDIPIIERMTLPAGLTRTHKERHGGSYEIRTPIIALRIKKETLLPFSAVSLTRP